MTIKIWILFLIGLAVCVATKAQTTDTIPFRCVCEGERNSAKDFDMVITYSTTYIHNKNYIQITFNKLSPVYSISYFIRVNNDSLFFKGLHLSRVRDTTENDVFIGNFRTDDKKVITDNYIKTDIASFKKSRSINLGFHYLSYVSHRPYIIGLAINSKNLLSSFHYYSGYFNFDCTANKSKIKRLRLN